MSVRKAVAATGLVAVAVAGGALGATLIGTADAAAPSPSPTAGGGSNEDPAHETGESAARETAENNGTATFGGHRGGGPNEDAAHEAGESAAREAAENNGTATFGGHHHGRGPNEDAAHEAGESAAREAAEGAESGAPGSATPETVPSPTATPSV
jgi:hypothetical protein